MKIIRPKKLTKGDLIGIITPASSVDDITTIETGVKYFEKLGYKVEVGKNVGKSHGYLAGSNEERLNDLHYMFKKKEVKAIISVRGGYGSPRLLDNIDYNLIKRNPKIFVGYSDITALQMAFFTKTGLITFAGPMVAVDFHNEVDPSAEENFWKIVTSNKKLGKVILPNDEKIFQLTKGNKSGRIIGGNLSLITSLVGTKFLPPMKGKILLLEEIAEAPYRIDRMLNQLRLLKIFNQVSGVILGAFIDCNEKDPTKKSLTLGEVIEDYFAKLKIPVVYNFRHGHIKDNLTVPLGINVRLNASRSFIEFLEPAVK
ncbi:MAG: S66 peptidase family protein [Ignavibacteriaceae bacterium]